MFKSSSELFLRLKAQIVTVQAWPPGPRLALQSLTTWTTGSACWRHVVGPAGGGSANQVKPEQYDFSTFHMFTSLTEKQIKFDKQCGPNLKDCKPLYELSPPQFGETRRIDANN